MLDTKFFDTSDEEILGAGSRNQESTIVVSPISTKLKGNKSTNIIGQNKKDSEELVLDLSSPQNADNSCEKLSQFSSATIATITANDNKKRESVEKVGSDDDENNVDLLNEEDRSVSTSYDEGLGLPKQKQAKCNDGKICSNKENITETHDNNKGRSLTADKNNKTVVVAGYRMDESYYNKAKSAKNILSRISSIMSGYWTDEQASKYCLKKRSDKPYLKQIRPAELLPIKEIFNAINDEVQLKFMNKKKNADKLDEEIRNCASSHFKARRKKMKNANTNEKPTILKLSNKYQDIAEIDDAIEKLIKKKKKK
ncbi:uncharacterized protein LOC123261383 [Cotesia glomerata]|uniref:uncharacterized protein LOC123261383 n=1 Tax=Cotesia glomerata TaxID=32391 RepID=UPI001D029843|nr:uncharacterized protein LOC123261383 [Cotesia glomerata]